MTGPQALRVRDLLIDLYLHSRGRPDCREEIKQMRASLRAGGRLPAIEVDIATKGGLVDGMHWLIAIAEGHGLDACVPVVWVNRGDGAFLFAAPGRALAEADAQKEARRLAVLWESRTEAAPRPPPRPLVASLAEIKVGPRCCKQRAPWRTA